MVLITLIGSRQAKEGSRFVYMGPLGECKECKLKGVCLNLEQGVLYEVTGLRDKVHDCEVHDENVRVVVVEKRPKQLTVPVKMALEGSTITYDQPKCDELGCKNHRHCHPIGMKSGTKITINTLEGDVECPAGHRLVLAKVA